VVVANQSIQTSGEVAGAEVVLARDGRWRLPAVVTPTGSRATVHHTTLAACVEALSAAGISCFGYEQAPGQVRLGISAADAGRVVAALLSWQQQHPGVPLSVARSRRGVLNACAPVQSAAAITDRERCVLVVAAITDPKHRQTLGLDSGVQLDIWAPTSDGTLLAREPNRWTDVIEPTSMSTATAVFAGVLTPTFPEFTSRHVEDVAFPVDVVYAWVDGSDPQWRERRDQAKHDQTGRAPTRGATGDERYRSADELRYSLRSIDQFAPWVNHIYVVTDQQRPVWLDSEFPGVTVVDHREIWIDEESLPVFNSHAIEANLHRIPHLSEHFVYLNDDLFLTRPTTASSFFTSAGLSRFFASDQVRIGFGESHGSDGAPVAAGRNSVRALNDALGVVYSAKLEHAPQPCRVSTFAAVEQACAEDFQRVAGSRFRDTTDIVPVELATWFGCATGTAVGGTIHARYIDINAADAAQQLSHLRTESGLDSFCLNQGERGGEPLPVAAIEQFLADQFRFKAPWEVRQSSSPA